MQKANANNKASTSLLALLFVAGLLVGAIVTSYITFQKMTILSNEVTSLQNQLSDLNSVQNATYQNITIYQNSTSLADIYASVRESVVLVQGTTNDGGVQGSGFVYEYNGQMIVITNNHVVEDADSVTVTFANENTYDAEVIGTDVYNDLAVLSVDAPESEYYPLEIASSSTASVGDYVVAIGSPYGLAGTMTTGIVSALDRIITITDDKGASYDITGLIQTSAPINSGNSGGPLMTYNGQVIGITTAIVSDSDGLGFVIPSDTILSVVATLLA